MSSLRTCAPDVSAVGRLPVGENVADVTAIASSVRLGGEDYVVAVAGPLERMEPAIPRHAKALRSTIEAIAAADRAWKGS